MLKEARQKREQGTLSADALVEIEDAEINRLVARQAAIGLTAITDGEVRRAIDAGAAFSAVLAIGQERMDAWRATARDRGPSVGVLPEPTIAIVQVAVTAALPRNAAEPQEPSGCCADSSQSSPRAIGLHSISDQPWR